MFRGCLFAPFANRISVSVERGVSLCIYVFYVLWYKMYDLQSEKNTMMMPLNRRHSVLAAGVFFPIDMIQGARALDRIICVNCALDVAVWRRNDDDDDSFDEINEEQAFLIFSFSKNQQKTTTNSCLNRNQTHLYVYLDERTGGKVAPAQVA